MRFSLLQGGLHVIAGVSLLQLCEAGNVKRGRDIFLADLKVNGNAWGCPVVQPVTGTFSSPPVTATFTTPPATQLDEEMVDQVVKEAISKPWLPLPLGLKPPSAESVLAELSRQGISAVPSSSSSCPINGSRRLR
ncbi:hypothetical protein F2Q69_00033391 [Brassica cretica]|uniref:Uncharacterized protein n=1 Tax=Brassica cretica TaxID=69181 RepID=A0A8S9SEJ6_BRACR|nr:hypothetical protein F2Q69_00033391 [Brassica cretica]